MWYAGEPMANAAPRHHYTLHDYLEVEGLSEVKHELIDGEILAMAGGSVEHAALSATVVGLLMGHLVERGGPCRAYSSDLRIRIREVNVATYADAVVVCDPVERDPESPTHVTNPKVVVEVLSPSTAAYDQGEKRGYYQRLPSLGEYVLVAQDRREVEVWRREEGEWRARTYRAGERAELASIALQLDVDRLYAIAGVQVP